MAATDPTFPAYLARLLGDPLTEGDAYVVHTDGDPPSSGRTIFANNG